ncbi:hypothetical protein [Novosphingobium sp. FKTRR1]|uniref:hypothetical protein n=1 Tax=Novosphingobium sp. FKTRR1 TaxID=2879118 RepID=UPI001CF04882|nr:hypothetical protein [Novosphingobium sp. FKTRR1]
MSFTHIEAKILAEIGDERLRQILDEGYDRAHDDAHVYGELARHAAVLAIYATLPELDRTHAATFGPMHYGAQMLWPWADYQFRLSTRRRDLVKAAALIFAEIERLDRAELARDAA